jgi:hypothetical protein
VHRCLLAVSLKSECLGGPSITPPGGEREWSVSKYDRLIESGFSHEHEAIELVGGQLIVAEPKGTA